ncbi:hypothetical protein TPHA_0A05480 [Tetrapisispora phaffii CBS 4417]|uniref:Glutamyl-tRNA(Gln) amidotransferase subunit A, mitochondrial n=1 Tax=Tetrapisispora phaffii (strain ATCC 24235 / CBS 4417 / NBRC 1672 / NRRL Y-8282 / UCD 70-5) TaxID=1071381 RepID=G8BNZ4_TETPH|nr:hypothetical protein TPHA_0A05480 [Tetrapisispora phaffii CBS 4417]CCE61622.1 hypothetical protein TPHA_0A05480 [Tetrapisispora phaffii CBS 4417]
MSYKSAIEKLKLIPQSQKKYNIFCYINNDATKSLKHNSSLSHLKYKPLQNVICGIKDNIVTKDMPTTCASEILSGYVSPFDATCVKLLRDQGVTISGKTNLDEFGMGSGGVHSKIGPTLNPLYDDIPTIVGGSSSGSAAAVAANIVDFSLGTDTGGSVRLPAAYTSILGFKPSYGRISRHGVIAYAQSFDTVGILSKDIQMIKKIFNILDKHDFKDPTSLDDDNRQKLIDLKLHNSEMQSHTYRIGLPIEFINKATPNNVSELFNGFVERLLSMGHELVPLSIPSIKYSLPIYYTLVPSEAASNLSRYDGIRFGTRDKDTDIEGNTLFASTRNKFGTSVKERVILGNYNLCSDSYKNNYIKAQKMRVQLIDEFDSIFKLPNILTQNAKNLQYKTHAVDFIIGLTSAKFPEPIHKFNKNIINTNEESNDDEAALFANEFMNDIYTIPMSLSGLPTISIPTKDGAPVGVQVVGQYGDDERLLTFTESILTES